MTEKNEFEKNEFEKNESEKNESEENGFLLSQYIFVILL